MLVLGRTLKAAPVSTTIIVIAAGLLTAGIVAVNAIARRMPVERQTTTLFAADIAIITIILALHGPRGLSVLLLPAILPFAAPRDAVGRWAAAAGGGIAFLASHVIHRASFPGSGAPSLAPLLIEAVALIGVSGLLAHVTATMSNHLRVIGDAAERAARGDLGARAGGGHPPELTGLAVAVDGVLNRYTTVVTSALDPLEHIRATITAITTTLNRARETTRGVHEAISHLASELAVGLPGATRQPGSEPVTSNGVFDSAQNLGNDANVLVQKAGKGREHVAKTSQFLQGVEAHMHTTRTQVEELRVLADRVGDFARSIGRIARQTRLLALNAAIEAAHAEEHGEGFASVAEEVRLLAAEAAASAHEIADAISELRARADAAAAETVSGEGRVRDIDTVAAEARETYEELHAGLVETTRRIGEIAVAAQEHRTHTATLATQLVAATTAGAQTRARAREAADQMADQSTAIEEIGRLTGDLARSIDSLTSILTHSS